jgi:hypothetical protein
MPYVLHDACHIGNKAASVEVNRPLKAYIGISKCNLFEVAYITGFTQDTTTDHGIN